ncbi:MAG TPA: hypothetical protein VER55_09680 [Ardenticatenaceae bacterium]|nr:hypothetical protein [Ardenticatenaceae bacterium]
MDPYFHPAVRLHRYVISRHWDGRALAGPDPGVRFNYRIGRFVKSYLPALRWADEYAYLQAQGYWTLANWRLFQRTGEDRYRYVAVGCSEYMLERQRTSGAWEYPNPEWKGRVATVEGTWASLGLLESYRATGKAEFLDGALRWHTFLFRRISFQQVGAELAVNYFADRAGLRVPNNSALVLRFLAELAATTGVESYAEPCAGLLAFLRAAQKPTGEFPYAVAGADAESGRPHFQCYQYNAFQCLDLLRYYEVSGDQTAIPLVTAALAFLRGGQAENGDTLYDCDNRYRRVTYHTAALAAAFCEASQALAVSEDPWSLGTAYDQVAGRAYSRLLSLQRPDGGFPYSRGDYRLLADRRSYPRYLAMILYHLLQPRPHLQGDTVLNKEAAHGVR